MQKPDYELMFELLRKHLSVSGQQSWDNLSYKNKRKIANNVIKNRFSEEQKNKLLLAVKGKLNTCSLIKA